MQTLDLLEVHREVDARFGDAGFAEGVRRLCARRVHAAVASHTDYNKMVIAVDEDVDPTDYEDVLWAFLTRDPMKDRWGGSSSTRWP